MPFSKYLSILSSWVWIGRWYVATIIVVLAIILWLKIFPAISLLEHCKEREARWLGWMLQIVGFLIIAKGYINDARQNDRLTPRRWLAQFPRPFSRNAILGSANGTITVGVSARGMLLRNVTGTSTVDERLAALEENSKAYFEETQAQWLSLDSKLSNMRADFDDHSATTSNAIGGLRERIVDSVAGRVQLNLFAVALFLVGISIATLSPELASLVGKETSCLRPLF